MSDIPVELLLAILGWIEDTAVLFNLHLVSKTFNTIAASTVLRESVQLTQHIFTDTCRLPNAVRPDDRPGPMFFTRCVTLLNLVCPVLVHVESR
jgi:hypothetical protein